MRQEADGRWSITTEGWKKIQSHAPTALEPTPTFQKYILWKVSFDRWIDFVALKVEELAPGTLRQLLHVALKEDLHLSLTYSCGQDMWMSPALNWDMVSTHLREVTGMTREALTQALTTFR